MDWKKVLNHLSFAICLLSLVIPTIFSYILAQGLVYQEDLSFFRPTAYLFVMGLFLFSYLFHYLSKTKEITFSALLFLIPIQVFILSAIISFIEPFDKNAAFLSLIIIPAWVWISFKVYQSQSKEI